MKAKKIEKMTTKEFRAFARSLPPEQAEEARLIRRRLSQTRWTEENREHVRAERLRHWQAWYERQDEESHERRRRRDREHKRRVRAQAKAG